MRSFFFVVGLCPSYLVSIYLESLNDYEWICVDFGDNGFNIQSFAETFGQDREVTALGVGMIGEDDRCIGRKFG